jgi:predicted Zn-dependent peptidase
LTKRILTPDEVIALVEAVTVDDLERVARELFITEKLNLAIVGPIKKEEPFAELLKF